MNNCTIEELLVYGKKHVHSDYAKILLAELLDKNPLELLNCLNEQVSEDIFNTYKKEVDAVKLGIPIQYAIGNVNFYGTKFYVDERVLIPRFETEELVENTIKYVKKHFKEPIDIVDLGCGSGVIGLTLEQKVNTTDSAVRITHLPTGLVVTCQNERSQIQNKEQAMKVLRARLYEAKQREQDEKLGSERKGKIGTGDRAEKIRTYNYPQNRVTDHRIGYTTNSLDRVMDGALDDIIEALITEDIKLKLKGEEDGE